MIKPNKFYLRRIFILSLFSLLLVSSCFKEEYPKNYQEYLNIVFKAKLDKKGNGKEIKLCLDRGADINELIISHPLPEKINPLIYALSKDSIEDALFLLEHNAKVNITDKNGNNALMWAIYHKNWDIAEILIEKGSDVNIKNRVGDTPLDKNYNNPLDYAARSQAGLDFFNLLFKNKAKISKRTLNYALKNRCTYTVVKLLLEKTIQSGFNPGISAYMQAVILNNETAVENYLKCENKSEIKEGEKGAAEIIGSSVFYMAGLGYTKQLEMIKKYGFIIDNPDELGNTPLSAACEYNQFETVKYLVSQGADINFHKQGDSPLDIAIKVNNKELTAFLISKGAKSFKEDPLLFAAEYSDADMLNLLISKGFDFKNTGKQIPVEILRNKKCIPILELLIKKGFNINLTDKNKPFSLLQAASYNYVDFGVFKWLIDNGADPKDYGNLNSNPLEIIIKFGSYKKLLYLLEHGGVTDEDTAYNAVWTADLEALKLFIEKDSELPLRNEKTNTKGNNLLHIAAFDGFENIIEYLISKGMNINKINMKGDTPLLIACKNHNIEAVKVLLKLNADISIKDKDGKTALQFAEEKKWKLITGCFNY